MAREVDGGPRRPPSREGGRRRGCGSGWAAGPARNSWLPSESAFRAQSWIGLVRDPEPVEEGGSGREAAGGRGGREVAGRRRGADLALWITGRGELLDTEAATHPSPRRRSLPAWGGGGTAAPSHTLGRTSSRIPGRGGKSYKTALRCTNLLSAAAHDCPPVLLPARRCALTRCRGSAA